MTFEQWFEQFKKDNPRMCTPTAQAMEIMYKSIFAAAQQKWQPPSTAPKDGSQFLADIGQLWPVICAWNGSCGWWSWAEHQIDVYRGLWNDVYFQTKGASEDYLKAWMPLPEVPEE